MNQKRGEFLRLLPAIQSSHAGTYSVIQAAGRERTNISVVNTVSVTPKRIRDVLRMLGGERGYRETVDDILGLSGAEESGQQVSGTDGSTPTRSTPAVELGELHDELDRPLHPTDVEVHGSLGTDVYSDTFDSWAKAGEAADVPVADPTWKDALSGELRLFKTARERPQATAEELVAAMQARLELLFPETGNIQQTIREELLVIKYDGQSEFSDARATQTNDSSASSANQSEPPDDSKLVESDTQNQSQDTAIFRLELNCKVLERQVRDGPGPATYKLLASIKDELEHITSQGQSRDHPRDLDGRIESVRDRARRAEQALDGDVVKPTESKRSNSKTDARRQRRERRAMLDDLCALAERFGESPQMDTVDYCGKYAGEQYIDAFGSWAGALEAAELEPVNEVKRELRYHSRIDALRSLKKVENELGRSPTPKEVNRQGTVPSKIIIARVGGWESAVDFVSTIDDGSVATGQTAIGTNDSESSSAPDTAEPSSEEDTDEGDGGILAEIERDMLEL